MSYELYISESALKELKLFETKLRKSIKAKLKILVADPFQDRLDVKKLKGRHQPVYYRLRVGDYRIIYHIKENGIFVDRIGPRKSIYRGF